MSAIKWLNSFLFLENLLGIYRNYSNQKKKAKYFIIFKLLLYFTIFTLTTAVKLYYFLGIVAPDQVNLVYSAFTLSAYVNSMAFVLSGIYHSSDFQSCYRSITRLSDWFKDDTKFIKSLRKTYWITIAFTFMLIVFVIIRSSEVIKKISQFNVLLIAMMFAVQTITRLTIIHQQIILFFVIIIVVYLFKSLNTLVSAAQERVGRCDIGSEEQCDITKEQIQEWVELYRDLANSCDKITVCFGHQYFLSLVLLMPNNILMTYHICDQIGLYNGFYSIEFKKVIMAIFTYSVVMLLPIVAGQLAQNQGRNFQRVLARLYNTIIVIDSSEAEVKPVKDFLRLIKKNPLEIKLLSNFPAGMYILPVILTLTINYFIVLLQFNHVI